MFGGTVHIQEELSEFALLTQEKKNPEEFSYHRNPVIIIAGPTAVGKSHLAMHLAKAVDGEIVSGDSMQVYKGMDIGTAKPSLEDRLEVPHHLFDTRDILEPYNAADYAKEAAICCKEIQSRGHVPIVVGGSGFYLHCLIYGPPQGPKPDPKIREILQKEMQRLGAEILYHKLLELDPDYAKTITPNDQQKVLRALEIIKLTGKKVSEHKWRSPKVPLNFSFRCWFLYRPRKSLYKRINNRCDEMIKKGFLKEVELLRKKGLEQNTSAANAIGYRQALNYLNSNRTEKDYTEFITHFKKASRHYAKRQFTWFRNENLFHWIDLDLHDPETVAEIIKSDYERLI